MECLIPPLGIGYLASYLLKHDVDVEIIDAQGEDPHRMTPISDYHAYRGMGLSEIVSRIDPKTDVIGISNMFTIGYHAVKALASLVRKSFPDTPIILGGSHPTHMPEFCLRDSVADYVFLGENEPALLEFCHYLQGKHDLSAIEGIGYLEAGKYIHRPAVRITNLNADHIPFPARHLLPIEKYLAASSSHGPTNKRWINLITSRGCPFKCVFCTSRKTKFVARSAKDVVDEVEHCIKEYGIEDFHFEDDNLTLHKPRLIEICDELIKRKVNIEWQTPNGIRSSVVTEELLKKMHSCGCKSIVLAPESGSRRVLDDLIQKGKVDFDHIVALTKAARKLKMKTSAFFVIGFPGETLHDIDLTIKYACRLAKAGIDEVCFSLFMPLPGTPLWSVVEDYFKGREIDFLELHGATDFNKAISWSEHYSGAELLNQRSRGYRKFLIYRTVFHPTTVFVSFLNVLKGKADTKSEGHMRTILRKYINSSSEGSETSFSPVKTAYVLIFKVLPLILFKKKAVK